MKKGIIISLIGVAAVAAVLLTCNKCNMMKKSEGWVEYKVTYPLIDSSNSMLSVMPDKMYFKFKDNNTISDLQAMGGLVGSSFISDFKNKKVMQTFRMLVNKYAAKLNDRDIEKMKRDFDVMGVSVTNETRIIAGKKCKEADIRLGNGTKFSVFFSEDFDIKNPNWSNPYYKINGVLMDFQVEKYGILMQFTATKVVTDKVDENEFKITPDYKMKTPAELEELLQANNPMQGSVQKTDTAKTDNTKPDSAGVKGNANKEEKPRS